ncbi:MAG: enoyl-CoA hydratase-related protein, partial [Granulosicoccaceae bacterium]
MAHYAPVLFELVSPRVEILQSWESQTQLLSYFVLPQPENPNMVFQGSAVSVGAITDGLYRLRFDLAGESVNKLNRHTLKELGEALDALEQLSDLRGLLLDSGKSVFIVGADITEFLGFFQQDNASISASVTEVNKLFNRLEDLDCPTVVAINGEALGGGFEVCLSCDFRVASHKAKIGLPETKLGIMPGWGGTVRLPRLVGVDNAIEWIAGGTQNKAAAALKVGAVDAVVAPEQLEEAALDLLRRVADGEIEYQSRRDQKTSPLMLSKLEALMAFESAKGVVGAKA